MNITRKDRDYLVKLLRKDQKKKAKSLEKNPQYEKFLPWLIDRCDRLAEQFNAMEFEK